jgi:hypothetical protein
MEISQLARDIATAIDENPGEKMSVEIVQLVLDKAEAVGGYDFSDYADDGDDGEDDEEDDDPMPPGWAGTENDDDDDDEDDDDDGDDIGGGFMDTDEAGEP